MISGVIIQSISTKSTGHSLYLIQMEGQSHKKIGPYRVSSTLLGKGSFSQVYLAFDPLGRWLAAKVIPINHLKPDQAKALEAQINILRRCRHENIVELIDVKKTHNHFYIFLEYCPDGTLAQHLENQGPLPLSDAISIFGQVARGMRVLTACKVLHRDIKPANILLSRGKVKLGDFGLAKRFLDGEMHQTMAGTPINMAPEMLKGEEYGSKVDVYSAGTVLYEMLFGCTPFKGKNNQALVKSIEKGLRKDARAEATPEVRQLLERMLHPDPKDRIDMNGVIEFLEDYHEKQAKARVAQYRELTQRVISGVGVMGAMLAAFNFPPPRPSSPSTMDLCLYSRLYKRLQAVKA